VHFNNNAQVLLDFLVGLIIEGVSTDQSGSHEVRGKAVEAGVYKSDNFFIWN